MTIVPETRIGKIEFYESHLRVWAEDPASIGLTPAAVADVQQLADDARQAFDEHLRAQSAARAATARYHDAVRRLHAGGAGATGGAVLIQTIKTFAQTTGDAAVYPRAQIATPSKPGRPGSAPAPGTPFDFRTNVRQTGEVELSWKCDNPDGTAGTIYQVRRGLDDGPLAALATVGEKRLLDHSLPPGTRTCTYEVTALRSTGKGASASYTIRFGNAHPFLPFTVKSRKLVA